VHGGAPTSDVSPSVFTNNRSQAVRLPAEYRFEGDEVLIRRDPVTGDIILSPRNKKFEDWVKLRDRLLPRIPQEDLAVIDDLRDTRPQAERDWP
jgi:antitoxin VapB